MKIVCLGDSITYGFGVPRSKCWVSLAREETDFTIINAGINGDTTGGMLARAIPDAFAENPDMLMLLGGTNDLANGCPLGTMQSNIAAILQQATHHNVRTMMGTLPPTYPALFPSAWLPTLAFRAPQSAFTAFEDWQRAFAESFQLPIVDFHAALSERSDPQPKSFFPDGLHPNQQGHRIMADTFLSALRML